jgi:hypothetical protein
MAFNPSAFGVGLIPGLVSTLQQKKPGFFQGAGEFFTGRPGGLQPFSPYSQNQMNIFDQLSSMGLQGFQNPYAGFDPIAQRATSQFQQQIIPSIAERFTSMGGGSLSSPAFASQLGQAGSGLAENLAALQSQYGLQNRAQMLSLLGLGLTPQYQFQQTPEQPGFLQQIIPSLGRLGLHAGAAALTGGASAVPSALSEVLRLIA